MLRWQNWAIVAETIWSTKPKIFTIWSFTKKLFCPSSRVTLRVTLRINTNLTYRLENPPSQPFWNINHIHSFPVSVQFSRSVVSNSLQPPRLQYTRLPCPSPTPRAYSNSCPSSPWCHPTSVVPFSSYLQSSPTSGSSSISQLFTLGGQSIGVSASASVPLMNIQGWFPLGWAGLISLQSKGLSRVFNTTIQTINSLVLSLLYSPTLIHNDYWKKHSFD